MTSLRTPSRMRRSAWREWQGREHACSAICIEPRPSYLTWSCPGIALCLLPCCALVPRQRQRTRRRHARASYRRTGDAPVNTFGMPAMSSRPASASSACRNQTAELWSQIRQCSERDCRREERGRLFGGPFRSARGAPLQSSRKTQNEEQSTAFRLDRRLLDTRGIYTARRRVATSRQGMGSHRLGNLVETRKAAIP